MAWIDLVSLWSAFDERIADHAIGTRTNRTVIDRFACGTIAAHIRTWIDALIVDACLRSFAIGTDDTLRMASGARRGSVVAWNAFANGRIAGRTANRVDSAWRWIARIVSVQWLFAFDDDHAATEGVAGCARRA